MAFTLASGVAPQYEKAASLSVHSDRPRLFIRPGDSARFASIAAIAGNPAPWYEWTLLGFFADEMLTFDATVFANQDLSDYGGDRAQAAAFLGWYDGTQTYIDWCTELALEIVNLIPVSINFSNDYLCFAWCERLACIYDWLYDDLSAGDRTTMFNGLVEYAEKLDTSVVMGDNFIGGHERHATGALAHAMIAIDGEGYADPTDIMGRLRDSIHDGYYATQSWIASDGGSHMAWTYARGYFSFYRPYFVWSVGTNDCVLDDWNALLGDLWVYGLRESDSTYPSYGDTWGVTANLADMQSVYSAGIAGSKNQQAKWLAQSFGFEKEKPFYRVLLNDTSVNPVSPADASLPLSKKFENSGIVVARDQWGVDATQLVFKCCPFYSERHHHFDENAFTLHYQVPLATHAAAYDGYNTDYHLNCHERTVGANCITVFDVTQVYTSSLDYAGVVENDGGQIFQTEPMDLADIQADAAGGGGIALYEEAPNFVFMQGDAAKYYDVTRVEQCEREIVFAGKTTYIFDRVRSANSSFTKNFNLHTLGAMSIDGLVATYGDLTCTTLYPTDATLTSVVASIVNGTDYPPSSGDPGYRLEVSPGTSQTQDYFLHALQIGDEEPTPVAADIGTGLRVAVNGLPVNFSFLGATDWSDTLMEIALGLTSANTGASTSQVDVTHTNEPGDGRILIAFIARETGTTNRDVTSVTFDPGGGDQASFALAVKETTDLIVCTEIWYLAADDLPTTGSNTIRVTTSDTNDEIHARVQTFTGVAQSAPEDAASDSFGIGAEVEVSSTVTTVSNKSLIVEAVSQGDIDAWTPTAGQTVIENAATANQRVGSFYKLIPAAPSVETITNELPDNHRASQSVAVFGPSTPEARPAGSSVQAFVSVKVKAEDDDDRRARIRAKHTNV